MPDSIVKPATVMMAAEREKGFRLGISVSLRRHPEGMAGCDGESVADARCNAFACR